MKKGNDFFCFIINFLIGLKKKGQRWQSRVAWFMYNQTTHGQHTKHGNQCPDPDSCQWYTNSIVEGKIICNLPTHISGSHTDLLTCKAGLLYMQMHMLKQSNTYYLSRICFLSLRHKLADVITQQSSLGGCNDALLHKVFDSKI